MRPWSPTLHLVYLNMQRQTVWKFLSENHQSESGVPVSPFVPDSSSLPPTRNINHLTLCPARWLQRASECHIPAPASTPRPRVYQCGRAVSFTTCELQPLWSAACGEITHQQNVTSCYGTFAGTKERIKCSRIFVTGRSVNQRCPGEVRVSLDTR